MNCDMNSNLLTLRMSSSDSNVNQININHLNNDCLVLILKHLPIIDKLIRVGLVCKRWNSLKEYIWSNVKHLEIDDSLLMEWPIPAYKYLQCENLEPDIVKFVYEIHTNFFVRILKNCGKYLDVISIDFKMTGIDDFTKILVALTLHCTNVKNLKLKYYNNRGDIILDDFFLETYFLNIESLNSLSLNSCILESECLSHIHELEKLEYLSLSECKIFLENDIYNFICHLINLKKIFVLNLTIVGKYHNQVGNYILDALSDSNCECISEFNLENSPSVENLLRLLSKQKDIKFLKIPFGLDKKIDKNFMDKLHVDNLEVLHNLELIDEISNCFQSFKKLTELNCVIPNFTDNCFIGLSQCTNLKKLEVEVEDYSATPIGEEYLRKLENLEYFKCIYTEINIDNLLLAVGECKNLRHVVIKYCNFTEIGFSGIFLLSNLSILNVSHTDLTERSFINLIRYSLNLEELRIKKCKNITKRSILIANEIKNIRNDKEILQIFSSTSRMLLSEKDDPISLDISNDIKFIKELIKVI